MLVSQMSTFRQIPTVYQQEISHSPDREEIQLKGYYNTWYDTYSPYSMWNFAKQLLINFNDVSSSQTIKE